MTEPPSTHEVTRLLVSWCDGDEAALERLMPLVHGELMRLARHYMGRERSGHTLQPTALVNEAYMRLVDWKNVRWQNRSHFFGVAAQMMRRILVDFARSRPAPKRDGGARLLTLGEADDLPQERPADLLALDEALTALAAFDSRKATIVELKFFGGLSVEETAEVLKLSPTTVMREWAKAKAWLYRELTGIDAGQNSPRRGW
jgi:RNA polymerase sigma factor (TIGR02999 family)